MPKPKTRGTVSREAGRGSSVKSSQTATDSLIDRTLQVWQPRFGRNLTREDARQIGEAAIGFFAVLAEWARAETQLLTSNAGKSPVFVDEDRETLLPSVTGTTQ